MQELASSVRADTPESAAGSVGSTPETASGGYSPTQHAQLAPHAAENEQELSGTFQPSLRRVAPCWAAAAGTGQAGTQAELPAKFDRQKS